MQTVAKVTEDKYQRFLDGSGMTPESSPLTEAIEDPNAFVLEKYLEDFIVSNFESIFKGTLKIHEEGEGVDGRNTLRTSV